MKALITQSNYIPWKGYFDNIAQCDVFVVFDDVQFTRRDWRNRNYLKTPEGRQWVTIPVDVKGKYLQKINATQISDKSWNSHHWNLLRQNYAKAPYFKEFSSWVEDLYKQASFQTLTEINIHFLKAISEFLGIKTIFRDSREFELKEGKNERLIGICRELGAKDYFTGTAAYSYLDEKLFTNENIKVHYFDYSGYPEYPQLFPPFEHAVSIWDLIFNVGSEAKKFIKYGG